VAGTDPTVKVSADGAEVHRLLWFCKVTANGGELVAIRITRVSRSENAERLSSGKLKSVASHDIERATQRYRAVDIQVAGLARARSGNELTQHQIRECEIFNPHTGSTEGLAA
jgi:hypothetical protein